MDINSIYEESGWGRYQYYIIANSSFSWMIIEFWFLGTAIIINSLNLAWGTSAFEAGMLTVSQSAGAIIGGSFFGWLADTKGRMYALKVTNIIYILFTAIMTVSVNIYMIIGCLFFLGAAYAGDNYNTSTMLAESLPLSKMWILTLFTANWGIGGVIMAFIGVMLNVYEVEPIHIFRLVWVFIELSCILLLVTRLYMDESPKYLLTQGKVEQAKQILEKMARINSKTLVFHQKQELFSLNQNVEMQSAKEEPIPILDNINSAGKSKLSILYTRPMLMTSLKLNGVFILQSGAVGLQTFMFLILKQTGSNPSQVMIYTIVLIQQAAIIPGVLVATKMVNTFLGRKWTGALGMMGAGVCSLVYIWDITFVAVIILSSISWFFLFIGYAGLHTLTPESFFTSVRGLGQGIAGCMSRVGAIFTSFILGSMLNADQYYAAVVYIAALLISCGVLQLTLRETKGFDVDKNLRIDVD